MIAESKLTNSSRLLSILAASFVLLFFLGESSGDEIHEATRSDEPERLRQLLSAGEDVNSVDQKEGFTPLHFAAQYGNIEAARLLLDAGADPNFEDKYGNLPIEYTVFDIITWNKEFMRDHGKHMGTTRLWHRDVFHLLIESGSEFHADILLLSAMGSNDPDLLDYIVQRGEVMIPENDARFAHRAVYRGAIQSLRWLIEKGAELDKPQLGGSTPLHIAARNGNVEIVRILLDAGVQESVSKRDRNGQTPAEITYRREIREMLSRADPSAERIGGLRADTVMASSDDDEDRLSAPRPAGATQESAATFSYRIEFTETRIVDGQFAMMAIGETLSSNEDDQIVVLHSGEVVEIDNEAITVAFANSERAFIINVNTKFCVKGLRVATAQQFDSSGNATVETIANSDVALRIFNDLLAVRLTTTGTVPISLRCQ